MGASPQGETRLPTPGSLASVARIVTTPAHYTQAPAISLLAQVVPEQRGEEQCDYIEWSRWPRPVSHLRGAPQLRQKIRLATWPRGHSDDYKRLRYKNQDGQLATLAGSLARLIPKVLAADLHGWKRIGGNEKQKNAMIILIALKAFRIPLHLRRCLMIAFDEK